MHTLSRLRRLGWYDHVQSWLLRVENGGLLPAALTCLASWRFFVCLFSTRSRLDSHEIRKPFVLLRTLLYYLVGETHGVILVAPSRFREERVHLEVTLPGARVFVCPV